MMEEEEFYEWFSQCNVDSHLKEIFTWYQKSCKYDLLTDNKSERVLLLTWKTCEKEENNEAN